MIEFLTMIGPMFLVTLALVALARQTEEQARAIEREWERVDRERFEVQVQQSEALERGLTALGWRELDKQRASQWSCEYCGTLNDPAKNTTSRCESCGANRQ